MTEFEKRDLGLMYSPMVCIKEMFDARDKCTEYNNIPYSKQEERSAFIKSLFGKTGKNITVENGFKCNMGSNIFVGDNFYCNFNCTIYDAGPVVIGNNVMIGPCVTLCTATHPTKASERINEKGEELLQSAFRKLRLSVRAYERILKVARTIADLENKPDIEFKHVAEAIQYRSLDKFIK